MSFGFENVNKSQVEKRVCLEDNYGLPNPAVNGLASMKKMSYPEHELQTKLKNAEINKNRLDMTLMRNIQGIHAPLRLAMEVKATSKVGRLPCLPSSFASRDAILHRDEEIGPQDLFNIPEFREQRGLPSAMIERSLGLF